jgi:hypothetical protein
MKKIKGLASRFPVVSGVKKRWMFEYLMIWSSIKLRGENKIIRDNNITIAVEKNLYLAGTILEFSGGINGKDLFSIIQTQSRTCGWRASLFKI